MRKISRDWESQKACSRARKRRSPRGAKSGGEHKRLFLKKFRGGKEREIARGRNWVGERGREKERATINVDVFLRPLGRRNVCSGKCNHAVI